MAEPSCPGCRERDAVIASLLERIAALEQRVRDLESRLRPDATHSSLPPPPTPPQAPKPVVKPPPGKKPGPQPAPPPPLNRRLPPQRLARTTPLAPRRCECCQEPLPRDPRPGDPEPTWHQVAELPEMAA